MSIVLDGEFRKLAEEVERLWGADAQIDMMIEECSELIQVLIKRKRKRNGSTISDIVNELVDVEIMLGQMKNIYGLNQDMWDDFWYNKIQRLKKRLEEKMERIPVQSTNLVSVGYDTGSLTLEIEFNTGSIYQYFGVPQNVYEELMGAASKGRYFDQNIKKAGYSYQRIG